MMSMPNINNYCFINSFFLMLILLPLAAQEKMDVTRRDFAKGIEVQLSKAAVNNSPVIAVQDSMARQMTLLSVRFSDQQPWLKMTSTAASTANTVHWVFDQESGELRVDFSSIRDAIQDGDPVTVVIAPVATRAKRLHWKIKEATSLDAENAPATTLLKDLTIEIK